jgi:uncharacterized coiled-coil DUF342 family protein
MSSRHTPETDAVAEKNIYGVACKVDVDFARKLERERDELQDALEHAQMTIGSIVSPSDKATLELIKVTKERDEAREQIKELIYIAERAIALAEIDFENDKFGVVSELRDGVERLKEGAK